MVLEIHIWVTSTQTQYDVLTSLKRILVLLITGIFDCNGLVLKTTQAKRYTYENQKMYVDAAPNETIQPE